MRNLDWLNQFTKRLYNYYSISALLISPYLYAFIYASIQWSIEEIR